ncbi:MAG: hypothetical protein V5A31_00440 [Haloferacaceae archaeon]
MIRTETCVEAAVRMAAGLIAVALGHIGGTFVASLFPGVGLLFYTISILPLGVAGLYAVATGLWVVVEGATGQALERHAASIAAAGASEPHDGDEPTDDNS